MVLQHNKTYLNHLDQRVKMKQVDNCLFRGSNGYMYFDSGMVIGKCYSYNAICDTDGTIKHFFKLLIGKYKEQ